MPAKRYADEKGCSPYICSLRYFLPVIVNNSGKKRTELVVDTGGPRNNKLRGKCFCVTIIDNYLYACNANDKS